MQPKFYFKYKKLIKYVLGLLLIGLTFFVTISLEKSVIILDLNIYKKDAIYHFPQSPPH